MRLLRLVLAGLVAACALVVVSSAPATACSCVDFKPQQFLKQSSMAFAGTAVEVRDVKEGVQVTVFGVDRVYKGAVKERTSVLHGTFDSSCGVEFQVDDEALVFTHTAEGSDLHTSSCSTVVDRADSPGMPLAEALERLGPGSPPAPGDLEVAVESPADSRGWIPQVLGGAVALVVVLFAVLAWSIRRQRADP